MSDQNYSVTDIIESYISNVSNGYMLKHGIETPNAEVVFESVIELNKLVHMINEYVGLNETSVGLNEETGDEMVHSSIYENCDRFLNKMFTQAYEAEKKN